MSAATYGLDNILAGGNEFLTFEASKPQELIFIDWYENLAGIREHYEAALTPKYIRCPGKDVCPLCKANPGQYPSFKTKLRVFDPVEKKVKFVSLAKSHIKAINNDFILDDIDPTTTFVKIVRTGSGAQDTSYSARASKSGFGKVEVRRDEEVIIFDGQEIEIPSLDGQITPHTPEEILGFMGASVGTNDAAVPATDMSDNLPF